MTFAEKSAPLRAVPADLQHLRRCQSCGLVKDREHDFGVCPQADRPYRLCHECQDAGRNAVPMDATCDNLVCVTCGKEFTALPFKLQCSRCWTRT